MGDRNPLNSKENYQTAQHSEFIITELQNTNNFSLGGLNSLILLIKIYKEHTTTRDHPTIKLSGIHLFSK